MTDINPPKSEEAKLAHARKDEWALHLNNHTVDVGLHALKTAGIINGGAAIAVLALLGNFAQNNVIQKVNAEYLGNALGAFGVGSAMAAFGAGFAYFLTMSVLTFTQSITKVDYPPFLEKNEKTGKWGVIIFELRILTIGLVFGSYFSFVYGLWQMKNMIENSNIWPS